MNFAAHWGCRVTVSRLTHTSTGIQLGHSILTLRIRLYSRQGPLEQITLRTLAFVNLLHLPGRAGADPGILEGGGGWGGGGVTGADPGILEGGWGSGIVKLYSNNLREKKRPGVGVRVPEKVGP